MFMFGLGTNLIDTITLNILPIIIANKGKKVLPTPFNILVAT